MQTYTFGVPAPHRELLKRVALLSGGQFDALAEALRSDTQPTFRTRSEFANRIRSALTDWTSDDAELLATALASMLSAASSHGVPHDHFARSVSLSGDLDLEDSRRTALAERLQALLASPDVLLSGKALDLATEYERRLHTVRILTDVRPVWGTEPNKEPLGGIVSHQLRIDVFTGYDSRPYFFALDRSDLLRLKEIVDRAVEKNDSLTAWFHRMGFREVDLVEAEDMNNEGEQ